MEPHERLELSFQHYKCRTSPSMFMRQKTGRLYRNRTCYSSRSKRDMIPLSPRVRKNLVLIP